MFIDTCLPIKKLLQCFWIVLNINQNIRKLFKCKTSWKIDVLKWEIWTWLLTYILLSFSSGIGFLFVRKWRYYMLLFGLWYGDFLTSVVTLCTIFESRNSYQSIYFSIFASLTICFMRKMKGIFLFNLQVDEIKHALHWKLPKKDILVTIKTCL